jgi:hypothetical protein
LCEGRGGVEERGSHTCPFGALGREHEDCIGPVRGSALDYLATRAPIGQVFETLQDPRVVAHDNHRPVLERLEAIDKRTADVAQIAIGVRHEPGSEV